MYSLSVSELVYDGIVVHGIRSYAVALTGSFKLKKKCFIKKDAQKLGSSNLQYGTYVRYGYWTLNQSIVKSVSSKLGDFKPKIPNIEWNQTPSCKESPECNK